MIKIELFEDTGPAVNGRGTTNPTWEMDLGPNAVTSDFGDRGGMARPGGAGTYYYSYERYVFAKVTCTNSSDYQRIKEVKWYLENNIAVGANYSLLYKTTNTYAPPTNTLGSGKTLVSYGTGNVLASANTSTTGPDTATSVVNTTDGATFYTDYLVLQFRSEFITPLGTIHQIPEIPINLIIVETIKD